MASIGCPRPRRQCLRLAGRRDGSPHWRGPLPLYQSYPAYPENPATPARPTERISAMITSPPALILPFQTHRPVLAPSVFLAPTAVVIGDVDIGAESSV